MAEGLRVFNGSHLIHEAVVECDLNAVGKPGLEADTHKAEEGMVVIKVKMFAAGKEMPELRETGLGVIVGAERGTGFDAGPDADETVFDAQVALSLMGNGFLAFIGGSNRFMHRNFKLAAKERKIVGRSRTPVRRCIWCLESPHGDAVRPESPHGDAAPTSIKYSCRFWRPNSNALSAGFARIAVGMFHDQFRLGHHPGLVVFVENAAPAEEGRGAVGIGDGANAALENAAVEAADNALDFITESLYKRVHAPSSCDGCLFTHNIRDQRRISTLFRKRQQRKSELGRSAERSPMQAWGEFGFRRSRIRKRKASPVQMDRRRAKRYTRVCAR
ncbi:MAG: hypothetical protein PHP98_08630, partial [Kiritimatiellae bacterium]|nr:hypothetical protein [Kiritimatiellia bacterium]